MPKRGHPASKKNCFLHHQHNPLTLSCLDASPPYLWCTSHKPDTCPQHVVGVCKHTPQRLSATSGHQQRKLPLLGITSLATNAPLSAVYGIPCPARPHPPARRCRSRMVGLRMLSAGSCDKQGVRRLSLPLTTDGSLLTTLQALTPARRRRLQGSKQAEGRGSISTTATPCVITQILHSGSGVMMPSPAANKTGGL